MLNHIAVKSAVIKEKQYKLTDEKGLYLLVHPNGSKYWRLKYRFAGKEKVLALGVFPDISLAKARDGRDEAKQLLKKGIDPSIKKAAEKLSTTIEANDTFEVMAREWHDYKRNTWSDGHAKRVLNIMELHLFPKIGRLPLKDINPQVALAALRQIEKRGIFETTHRCKQFIGAVFKYAKNSGRVDFNPVSDLTDVLIPPPEPVNFAALDIKDLPLLWKKIDQNSIRMFETTRQAIRLMIYTFIRTKELRLGEWQEVDFDNAQWIIPKERMKMGREHIVPLSKQSMDIMRDLYELNGYGGTIFPSPSKPQQPMSEVAMLTAIKKMGFQVTVHGFRSMASTNMNGLNMARSEVIEKQLAHEESNKVKKAYNRAEYLDERTKLMQDWADYVDSVVA